MRKVTNVMNSKGLLREGLLISREIEDLECAIANGQIILRNALNVLVGRLSLVEGLYQLAIENEQRPSYLF